MNPPAVNEQGPTVKPAATQASAPYQEVSPIITAILAVQAFHPGERKLRLPGRLRFLGRPLLSVESWLERLVASLRSWALVDLLQILAAFGLVVTAGQYWAGREGRRKASHYAAWQLINSAHGKAASGGRIDALQDLAKDGVSLARVSLDNAQLDGIQMPRAYLIHATLQAASLQMSNLQGANLQVADLRESGLAFADLRHAELLQANLEGADLNDANLQDASLAQANLKQANLAHANLRNASLRAANLQNAGLIDTDVRGANFSDADMRGAVLGAGRLGSIQGWREIESMLGANISGVIDAPPGFHRWAIDTMGAIDSTVPTPP